MDAVMEKMAVGAALVFAAAVFLGLAAMIAIGVLWASRTLLA
ncbi:hypothetical protein [Chelatococcus asaccharovorans]|nr:hypothetical protein [Chelatococcus asaccharovorans]CAH1672083.1 hypothetical protein CHELA17_61330 [Chelatococcus asaccharovorans]CAH1676500.1 hypothetical protein CHELA40_14290 [Chelatococcus asaccharovorans]